MFKEATRTCRSYFRDDITGVTCGEVDVFELYRSFCRQSPSPSHNLRPYQLGTWRHSINYFRSSITVADTSGTPETTSTTMIDFRCTSIQEARPTTGHACHGLTHLLIIGIWNGRAEVEVMTSLVEKAAAWIVDFHQRGRKIRMVAVVQTEYILGESRKRQVCERIWS